MKIIKVVITITPGAEYDTHLSIDVTTDSGASFFRRVLIPARRLLDGVPALDTWLAYLKKELGLIIDKTKKEGSQ